MDHEWVGMERLQALSDLLEEVGEATRWKDPLLWERIPIVLNELEQRPEIDPARRAYIRLLDHAGWGLLGQQAPPAVEKLLQEYCQRALQIVRDPLDEGLLLFHLGSSIYRSDGDSPGQLRRSEAYLQQATVALGSDPAAADVHFMLGQLYIDEGKHSEDAQSGEDSPFGRAAFHYRRAMSLGQDKPELVKRSQAALETLLQPGLEVEVSQRFLTGNDIRIAARVRGMSEVRVEAWALPWMEEDLPVPLELLGARGRDLPLVEENRLLDRRFPMARRNPLDWQSTELRLGSDLPGGWYWLRISGRELVRETAILVTRMEAGLFPKRDGSFTLFAVDAESGLPMQGTRYLIRSSTGEALYSGTLDPGGLAEVVTAGDPDWSDVYFFNADEAAVVRQQDVSLRVEPHPLAVSATPRTVPGSTLRWALITGSGTGSSLDPNVMVQLPDGGELIPVASGGNGSLQWFEATIPYDSAVFGPVYLSLADGHQILLSHLERPDSLALRIEFSGERFLQDREAFIASSPVQARFVPDAGFPGEVSPFLRVLVYQLHRSPVTGASAHKASHAEDLVQESIVRYSPDVEAILPISLSGMEESSGITPLRIEARLLESNELAAESHLIMIPYRSRVHLAIDQKILLPGQSVRVSVDRVELASSVTVPPEGELVVYREAWENSYIHRKRGTTLSEAEYAELPERSILGTARTDYRLLEISRVREETSRISLKASTGEAVPVTFDLPGYYRIEFTGRDSDLAAHYPEGPLEVWVVPEDGGAEVTAFRSDRPRLLVEPLASGGHELLILMDRPEASVLVDLETLTGDSRTLSFRPATQALYLRHSAGEDPLALCRALISGNGRTESLCRVLRSNGPVEWRLMENRLNGLNPGSEFAWEVQLERQIPPADSLWLFYRESEAGYLTDWLQQQQACLLSHLDDCHPQPVFMSTWLPFQRPPDPSPAAVPAAQPDLTAGLGVSGFTGLYPEIVPRPAQPVPESAPQVPSLEPARDAWVLKGRLPTEAGRWGLTAISSWNGASLATQVWSVSTELPIRTGFSAPSFLRPGDVAAAILTASNTTRRPLELELLVESEGAVSAQVDPGQVSLLEAGMDTRFRIPVRAERSGTGSVTATVRNPFTASSSFLEFRLPEQQTYPVLECRVADSGLAEWSAALNGAATVEASLEVSAGVGSQLTRIWPLLRPGYVNREPLLARLIDWAMVETLFHHGLHEGDSSAEAELLVQEMQRHSSASGLAWTPGTAPDPWLNSLVLWSLETFSGMSESRFEASRRGMRQYLEAVLIDNSTPLGARIFALRTLSARAYRDPLTRPTRVQARSFLEFFQSRENLGMGEIGMLMEVARAYHFSEEVRLLADLLEERLNASSGNGGQPGFWESTLTYFAMDDTRDAASLRAKVLAMAMRDLSAGARQTGWLQAGGLLNLLAEFLWDGDFSVEGSVQVRLGEAAPLSLSLEPDSANRGHLHIGLGQLAETGPIVRMDTRESSGPVMLTVLGRTRTEPVLAPFPRHTVRYAREFLEETLLAGSHLTREEASLDTVFHPGDSLQMEVEFELEDTLPYAELRIAIPAGTQFDPTGLRHEYQSRDRTWSTDSSPLVPFGPDRPLVRVYRLHSLQPGMHRLVIPYGVRWQGFYAFPAHRLILPESGRQYTLGQPGMLRIDPPE